MKFTINGAAAGMVLAKFSSFVFFICRVILVKSGFYLSQQVVTQKTNSLIPLLTRNAVEIKIQT